MNQGCLKLEAPDGTQRSVRAGEEYVLSPGEKLVGVDMGCGQPVNRAPNPHSERSRLLKELNAELGTGAGDWVKSFVGPVAKLLNKDKCQGCEVRRVVLNAYANLKAKHGMLKSLQMIRDLEVRSANGGDHLEILTQLRAWLDA